MPNELATPLKKKDGKQLFTLTFPQAELGSSLTKENYRSQTVNENIRAELLIKANNKDFAGVPSRNPKHPTLNYNENKNLIRMR